MSASIDREELKADIILDTQYAVEDFTLVWRVAQFSQLFDVVHVDFSLENSSTSWTLYLNDKRFISLHRSDLGKPVNAAVNYTLESRHSTFLGEKFHKFDSRNAVIKLLNLEVYRQDDLKNDILVPIEFENDVLKLHLKIKIVGPAISKDSRSTDFLKPNLEKLRDDFRNLFNNKEHCDLTISVGNRELQVHKAVLCARSKVFDRMFQSTMSENNNNLLELNDLDFDGVEKFVAHLYTGDVRIVSTAEAMKLYYVADKYDVQDLREKCSLYLGFNLNVGEACSVLKLAELHRDDRLKIVVGFFMQMDATAVKLTDGWKDLVKHYPKLAFEVLK